MHSVGDMVQNLQQHVHEKHAHQYKLRERSQRDNELKVEQKLDDVGSDDVCLNDKNSKNTHAPQPIPIAQPVLPTYEVDRILDVAREGKKRNGPLIYEVLWKVGGTTWETVENFLGGAQYELSVFLETLSPKQKGAFKKGEYNKLLSSLSVDNDESDIERALCERVYSPDGEMMRKLRLQENMRLLMRWLC
jgi:hypothetical protein